MNTLTIAEARGYIISNYGEAKHNVKSLVLACRKLGKEEEVEARDLFHLLIENEPMTGTHSYGFHTAYGRALINTLLHYYYQIDRGLKPEQVLILS